MKIDTHIHVFAENIREKAAKNLTETADLPSYTDFSEDGTRQKLRQFGIDLGVVLPIATNPAHQTTINNWAASISHDKLIAFGTVHPKADDVMEELARIKELGLFGIKLHPAYQQFFVDDKAMYPIYEKIASLGLPLCLHCGFDPVSPKVIHCMPQPLSQVLRDLPELKVIAAHMGGIRFYDDVEKYLVGTNVYFDTSMSPVFCSQAQFARIIKDHGADKILFASDLPWSNPQDEMDMIERAKLSEEEKELIYWKNAAKLLQIPPALL